MSADNTQNNDLMGRRGWFTRFLDGVEWLGNLLPHPITLFALFSVFVILASGIASYFGLAVADPRPGSEGEMIAVNNLLSGDGLRYIVSNLVTNFTNFPPLGVVLVAILGVGIAERSGLLEALLRGMVMRASPRMVTVTVVFTGVISNTASELGYVVLVPLAAMIFHSLGRHPLAGLAAAFAGVSAGYSANLFIGTVDPLLAGFTTSAAQLIDPDYVVGAEMNWYFMFASTFLIAILGAFVTEKIVEPKLGKYNPDDIDPDAEIDPNVKMEKLSKTEKKGLIFAGLTFVALLALLAITIIPENGVLRNQETGEIAKSPFLNGIVVFIFITFAIPGFVYGYVTKVMRNDRDVIDAMAKTMSSMGLYIVLVFFAAQFVAFFGWTNFGTILAVNGANFLQSINLTGPMVFILFIMMCAFVNLMIGSASAQWAVTAPIFVPMLMLIGYAPELIQAAYRIGDSVTNIITPMMSYFGLILAVAARYQKNLGIGTLISIMLPYSMVFFVGWMTLFFIFVFVLGFPVGPGAETYYTMPGN
ncbi:MULTISPECIES: AbgT family transporter [Gammaproteobacteria]|uniref:AbgT family transporter n=1 Tax=Gammaproteobacteria TaxID=1236 RepID=UPI000DD00D30|nr:MULTISPECIES: AbgT family transporter [Gammaproteobacteria]RTE86406.1 AbgT family transporter [Aliidiomarina sp. B3213]TCZ91754.1 AbgT family transporter [Lysobacter sp. N42]